MLDLQEKYKKEAMPAIRERLGCKNIMSCPKIIKVVVNTGVGRIAKESGMIDDIRKDLSSITGQWPVLVAAKKSISTFKIRKGMPAGLKVTLHGKKMYDFLYRLISIAFPRSRDFRGIERKNIDQNGNLNIGIKEHIIFPEAMSDDIRKVFGLEVNIVTSAKDKEEAEVLFESLGFPFKNK
ncbi:MAG: 50S ribosomal protein L5 [Parcubacteria group bacterium GW2011_GWA2_38_13b]|nr:MAG: 50S ribosomal protein L5 [Parcubacteria group bacterium GW2011_GWA2_38_13b]